MLLAGLIARCPNGGEGVLDHRPEVGEGNLACRRMLLARIIARRLDEGEGVLDHLACRMGSGEIKDTKFPRPSTL